MFPQILIGILLLSSGIVIYSLCEKNQYLNRQLQRYGNLISQENFEAELAEKIHYYQEKYSSLNSKVKKLKEECGYFEEELDLQSWGFYRSEDVSIFLEDYSDKLRDLQLRQKEMADNQTAIIGPSWTTIGQKEGEKLLKDLKKNILFIFNQKCSQIISKVKPGEFAESWLKIEKTFNSINKLACLISHSINEDYLDLKEDELRIKYGSELRIKEEKELKKQDLSEERERQKEEREIRKAQQAREEAEEQEEIFQRRLDLANEALRNKVKLAEKDTSLLVKEVEECKMMIGKLQEKIQQETDQIGRYKRGHIFVLSNIGSLGEGIYRIFSTRSLDEDNYIRSMNVHLPFPFDVHIKIFSEDAENTINHLHSFLQSKRVNKINLERHFFRVPLQEVVSTIEDIYREAGMVMNFIVKETSSSAIEYHETVKRTEK